MIRTSLALALVALSGCSSSSSSSGATADTSGFLGTWNRSGTLSSKCGTAAATETPLTGTLTVTSDSGGNGIVATDSVNHCTAIFTVSGSVASAASGQTCAFTGPTGNDDTLTAQTHTLTLSADGKSLAEASTGTITSKFPDGGVNAGSCTSSSSGTFTKQ